MNRVKYHSRMPTRIHRGQLCVAGEQRAQDRRVLVEGETQRISADAVAGLQDVQPPVET